MKQKIIVVVGPTASGKSALGVLLAKRFNGEVISADSRQVYKGLDIGTGKITKREMKGIPHHLLDVASVKKRYSAGDFVRDGHVAISRIAARGKVPIIVGGTGFYTDALVGRITLPEVVPNAKLRASLGEKTAPQLYTLLRRRDPARARMMASKSERNNKVRLVRALEVALAHPKLPSRKQVPLYDIFWIGIAPPTSLLEKKMRTRLNARIRKGMVAEAQKLKRGGLSYARMKELGLEYRSLARFLQKEITRSEFEEELYRDIRRYAKKQLAYWRRNDEISWFQKPGKVANDLAHWLEQ